ncbi:peptidoglycan-binding protein [Oscillatoria sp. FACHB-1406]|nr:peptidoglycan-binding protein [Oscillatoria sp. FACHB-1406]
MLAGLPARAQYPTSPTPQAAPAAAPATTVELPTLRKGASGGAVRLLQNILIAGSHLQPSDRTGSFDNKTEAAVKKFQTQYNLTADGIVGAATWRMLGGTLWD